MTKEHFRQHPGMKPVTNPAIPIRNSDHADRSDQKSR